MARYGCMATPNMPESVLHRTSKYVHLGVVTCAVGACIIFNNVIIIIFSRRKTPDFLQAWFACARLPPGVLFLGKKTPDFLQAWVSWARRPPGVFISGNKTPDFLKAWVSCARRPPGVYFSEK